MAKAASRRRAKRRAASGKRSKPRARKRARARTQAARKVRRKARVAARRPVRRKRAKAAKKKRVARARPRRTKPTRARRVSRARPRKAPALERERRLLREEEYLPPPLPAFESGPVTGRGPALTGGDIDAQWRSVFGGGEEASGPRDRRPDRGRMDEPGGRLGFEPPDMDPEE